MEQRWKSAHHVTRRRTGDETTLAATSTDLAAGTGGTSINRNGSSQYLPQQSSLFCAPNGADLVGASSLKDEECLTDIIENAFNHHRPFYRGGKSSASSTGSIGDTSLIDSDNEYFQSTLDLGAASSPSAATPRRKKPTSFWNKNKSSRRSSSGSSLLRLDTKRERSMSLSNVGANISPKVLRLTCLIAMTTIVSLSLRNSSQNLREYGQLHRTGSIYGRGSNRSPQAAAKHQQQYQEQLQLKKEAESQGQNFYAAVMKSPNVGVPIPLAYKHLVEVSDSASNSSSSGIPFFWHLPRSGGSTVRDLLTDCHGLVMATGQGKVPNDVSITSLKVLERPIAGSSQQPNITVKFLNVDVYNKEGIEKAKELGLAYSGLVDVVSSRLVLEASSIFDSDHRGRLFTLFRHPIHRAVSTFHFVQDTVWRRNRNDLADITIEEYFKSGSGENNFMTRYLTGGISKVLTEQDLNVAKEILRRKCIVGLLEEKVESMSRFELFFGWKLTKSQEKIECREKRLQWGWSMSHQHDVVKEGSVVWDLILKLNEFDIQLYDYAKLLFKDQRRLFAS